MATPTPTTQSPAERKAAEAVLRELIDKFSPDHHRLVGTMRRWVLKRIPTTHEVVYEYRDCWVVSFSPSGRGFEGVLAIRGSEEGVRLYFQNGKGLPDPEKLLQGSANTRFVPVEGAAALKRPAVVRLVELALTRNKVPFAKTGRGPMIIQSLASKKPKQRRT